MPSEVFIQLDPEIRQILEAEARARNIELASLLREIATQAAKQVRRRRIREQSEAVANYAASSAAAREFLEFWGTPRMELPPHKPGSE